MAGVTQVSRQELEKWIIRISSPVDLRYNWEVTECHQSVQNEGQSWFIWLLKKEVI